VSALEDKMADTAPADRTCPKCASYERLLLGILAILNDMRDDDSLLEIADMIHTALEESS
jgi:hypothetical protein